MPNGRGKVETNKKRELSQVLFCPSVILHNRFGDTGLLQVPRIGKEERGNAPRLECMLGKKKKG